ncbi:hypothetical protein [Caballeronia sp. GAWG1-5s-s]|uniref:hypothetical protein n=1 Tax=Caballeronia sp. GAWG1-5s-s TaxID=2921743 RepID=UPI0020289F67|nr:hypothetical protein [Caballeronia sp. GAWG1-5s-s]
MNASPIEMAPKRIGRLLADEIPPRAKIAPRADRNIDMSTPEARERVMQAVRKVIRTHNVAIKALAKR